MCVCGCDHERVNEPTRGQDKIYCRCMPRIGPLNHPVVHRRGIFRARSPSTSIGSYAIAASLPALLGRPPPRGRLLEPLPGVCPCPCPCPCAVRVGVVVDSALTILACRRFAPVAGGTEVSRSRSRSPRSQSAGLIIVTGGGAAEAAWLAGSRWSNMSPSPCVCVCVLERVGRG